MSNDYGHVCPVERAGGLDNRLRRWVQNPLKILGPYLEEGMTALDVGCGPGFFTTAMAQLAGSTGRVIAVDLQEGMLQKLKKKISGSAIEKRITLHRCDVDRIGIAEPVDFVLLFYMVHEIPDKDGFFKEIKQILQPTGQVLLVEPPFHVSRAAFDQTLRTARAAGFTEGKGPHVFLGKSVILKQAVG